MNKKILISIFSLIFIANLAAAEEYLVLSSSYVSFEPKNVSLFVQFDDKTQIANQGSFQKVTSTLLKENYFFAGVVDIPKNINSLKIVFLVQGEPGQIKGVVLATTRKSDILRVTDAEKNYKDELLNLNQKIDLSEEANQQVKSELRGFKKEMERDPKLKQLTAVQERLRQVEGQKAALDRQLINLEFLLQESQTQKLPYNYAKRELELTSQLSELANAAKRVESLEADNQNLEGLDVEEMLELIERAKAYDAEVLAARIRGLEKRISASKQY